MTSIPTLYRVRPNRRILPNRRSKALTRSPHTSPGATRLIGTVVPTTAAGRPPAARGHELDRPRRADDGRRTAERRRDERDRGIPVGREDTALIAAERARD